MIMRAEAPTPGGATLDGATALVRERLEAVAELLQVQGVPVPELRGKLLRPLLAYLLVPPPERAALGDRFWLGALAIQMVHEASLVHDDIIDEAAERRGEPTIRAERGVGHAVALGDHYLTGAYRAAVSTGSMEFVQLFVVAVERTVAGEILQGSGIGSRVDLRSYLRSVLDKSGQLLGAAACLGRALDGDGASEARGGSPQATGASGSVLRRSGGTEEVASLGRRLGALYQQIDDLLDYCVAADTGKEPLQDYRQRKWTWVLDVAGVENFEASEAEIAEALFRRDPHGVSAGDRALLFLESRRRTLIRRARNLGLGHELLEELLEGWLGSARDAVSCEVEALARAVRPVTSRPTAEAAVVTSARAVGGRSEWGGYFSRHARTFSAAARLFPRAERRLVEGVYAYCRFTDDLVDDPAGRPPREELARRLGVWAVLSRAAYEGEHTGIELLDAVMGDARRRGVSWTYPRALLDGVAMDLVPREYADWPDLLGYTFCVAGSVGGWLTQIFGSGDPITLDRAHSLGHAMQLTNIVRDVGEDLECGRVYLPRSVLDRHGVSVGELEAWRTTDGTMPVAYPAAMEELMRVADGHYRWARPGIRALPGVLRRPVAAAAEAYRGIHREVRRNGYDNLSRRAHTSSLRKIWLGAWGLVVAYAPTSPASGRRRPGIEEFAT